jgi:hypothetical protein
VRVSTLGKILKQKMNKALGKHLALLLWLMHASCAATPHARVEGFDLARSVLLIRELPDGQVTHSWRRFEDFDLSEYRYQSSVHTAARHIVLAMNSKRDCDEENNECIRKCMSRPLSPGYGHITSGGRGKGGKEEFCVRECQQAFDDCRELEKLKPQDFMAVESAIDWLKRNHKVVLVGTVVIIAGVTFVVISAGAGLVILAPVVLLAAPEPDHPRYMAGASL